MIALDTSSLIAYFNGESGEDVEAVVEGFLHRQAALPPVVLTEILSAPDLDRRVDGLIRGLPLLEALDGYWERAGLLRARLLRNRVKARLADTLIAQTCIDHDAPLVTRDQDFRHFARLGGLKLL